MVTAGKELTQAVSHRLVLEGRNMLSITGVTDAVSFDEAAAVLETAGGTLIIRGASCGAAESGGRGGAPVGPGGQPCL